jgi:plasmid replication initiation protein
MKTDLTTRNYTKQSHVIVNAKYALKKNEIDMVLTLLTAITDEDKDFKDYEFTKEELEQKTNRKWDTKQLKDTVYSLMQKPLTFQEEDGTWEVVNWFSYFKYKPGGFMTCRFDKRLKPYFIEIIGSRALADFRHLLPMKSSYSKRMYLLLKLYNKIGSRTFKLKELHEILKVPKSFRDRYDNFKREVLKKSEADINKFTDLEINFIETKKARKVVEITFTIKKNHTDLKAFIGYIRELYINQPLYKSKEDQVLKCSEKGLLYYADNSLEKIDKETSMKLWQHLHEHKENLICFQQNEFEQEEVMNRLKEN